MTALQPETERDARYSGEDAIGTPWADAEAVLREAEIFWISTVRSDGRPHVTPLIAVWPDGALAFCTGAAEQKARNLARTASCTLTTGCNRIGEGLDVVVEGEAVRVRDDERLRSHAEAYVAKYGEGWRFGVRDGEFVHRGGESTAPVYELAPVTAFGFSKGEFSQTRWRFAR
jgi:nitroimidazol reductase NimA-like FMN-containing flavoprotein (pyridoxamine 5'-phosphate oxidase superfamily)